MRNMQAIMTTAWTIRKAAAVKYGCNVCEINMAACLRMAWAGVMTKDFTATTAKGIVIHNVATVTDTGIATTYKVEVVINPKTNKAQAAMILDSEQALTVLGMTLPPNGHVQRVMLFLDDSDGWIAFEQKSWAEMAALKAAKLDAMFPGLSLLRAALAAESSYDKAFQRAMERGSCKFPTPIKAGERYADLAPQYPQAVAYLKADGYADASHDEKAAAGRKALNRMMAGEDAVTVAAEMETEWSTAASRCVANN